MINPNNPFSLNGKTILVTGASSGIGRETAIQCSKAGATVVLTARDETRLSATLQLMEARSHIKIVADLSSSAGLEELINQLPALDGAVLCAGIVKTIPIQFASTKKFEQIFNLNFFSQTELTRLLYKKKILKSGSSLIFLSSEGGTLAFNSGNAVYGSSKAALNSFMKFCSLEFASRNIRVNSICPGMINTPMIHEMAISDEQMENYKAKYVLKRFGNPEDVAYGAIYLLSDASSWVTGISLYINGGGVELN